MADQTEELERLRDAASRARTFIASSGRPSKARDALVRLLDEALARTDLPACPDGCSARAHLPSCPALAELRRRGERPLVLIEERPRAGLDP